MHENKGTLLRKELDAIYTPLEVAKQEIWKRWNDKELRNKVEIFLKGDIPEVLKKSPRIALSRHVLSPNFELLHFLELAKSAGLEPVGLEYLQDKFVTINEDKYYLAKLVFYEGIGKNGGRKISAEKIIDIDLFDGKKFPQLKTLWDGDFITFHHELVCSLLPADGMVDMSEYYRRNGVTATQYYTYILSLFICHGVLCESFLLSAEYENLTRDILLPRFRDIEKFFGLKPLIVRLSPLEKEEDTYWRYYPQNIREMIPHTK